MTQWDQQQYQQQWDPQQQYQQPHPQQAPAKPRRSRWLTVGVPIICSIVAFGFGAASGSAGSAGERMQLSASEKSLHEELRDARTATSTAQKTADTAKQAVTEVRKDLTGKETRVAELESQVAEHTARSATLTQERDALAAQVAELQATGGGAPAQAAEQPQQPQPQQAQPQQSAPATYYKNCTAAREAGVTPLYQGSPGYSRHLDRDGDGIACE